VEIKTKKSFNSLIKSLAEEILNEDGGVTTTDDIAGYNTPFAFGKNKKRKKRISTNSTGFKQVNEALDDKDLKQISKMIRDVVGDILRDIWLKRNAWK
jgi:endonuclease IV|tara:strand:+ start:1204 stop:1497 length:294 start_codon:yes stop_codon:yes gene_type:complete